MKTNADLTHYRRSITAGAETYTRAAIYGVAWEDRRAANARTGVQADDIAVYIPLAAGGDAIQPGDLIVKGVVADALSTTFTPTALRAKYPNRVGKVISVDLFDQGSPALQHRQVGAA